MRRHFTDTHGRRRGEGVGSAEGTRAGQRSCDVSIYTLDRRAGGKLTMKRTEWRNGNRDWRCQRGRYRKPGGAGKGVGGNPPLSQKRPKEVRGDPKAGGRKTTPQSRDHGRRLQHRWCRRGGTQRTLGVGIDWKHKVVDERLDGMAYTQRACGGVVMGRRTVGQKL